MSKMFFQLIAMILVSSCATIQPEPFSTPLPPTESPEDVVIEVGDIIFDGTECPVSGLNELPPGRYS